MQLSFASIASNRKALILGLGFKLVAAPLVILMLYRGMGWSEGLLGAAIILESAMAPQIGAGIVAMQHKLNPPLVALMLGLGIPASFLSVPAWNWVVTQLA